MTCFLTPIASYYEGDRASALDQQVPQRPSPYSTWDGAQWVTPDAATIQDLKAQLFADAVDRIQFDLLFQHENSVRALRTEINLLSPGRFTVAQASQVTRVQFRDFLIQRWKALNP